MALFKSQKIFRQYSIQNNLTQSKHDKVLDIIRRYRRISRIILNDILEEYQKTGYINKGISYKTLKHYRVILEILPKTAYIQMALTQVIESLLSRESNIQKTLHDFISRQKINETDKHQLLTCNGKSRLKPGEVSRLYRRVYKHVTKKWKLPDCSHITMRVDNRGAIVNTPVHANQRGKIFAWMKFKLLDRGESVEIPLLRNEYFTSKEGSLANSVLLGEKDGRLFIRVMKDRTEHYQQKQLVKRSGTLALDFGLRVMFTDHLGGLHGRSWMKDIQEYDKKIQARAKVLQEQGLVRLREDRVYVRLVDKFRSMVKNSINRVMNRLYLKNPERIIVEKLDFRSPDLSRRMNRLVQNCGRRVIEEKLKEFELIGIKVVRVNPAYTSQTCSECGFVSRNNRKGERFACLQCGKKLHADVNGARNILLKGLRYLADKYKYLTVKNKFLTAEPCSVVFKRYSAFTSLFRTGNAREPMVDIPGDLSDYRPVGLPTGRDKSNDFKSFGK